MINNDRRRESHGRSGTPEYRAWSSLIQRCTNPRNPRWADYGGRGITVCDRWRESFAAFLADMGERPSAKHSIDRIDNDRGYEPGNCRWTTQDVQISNMRVPAGGYRHGVPGGGAQAHVQIPCTIDLRERWRAATIKAGFHPTRGMTPFVIEAVEAYIKANKLEE